MTQLANPALFNFPPQAQVGRVLPKSKIYEHGRISTALRERFVKQVEQITWQYKLAPETINLPARAGRGGNRNLRPRPENRNPGR
jgi:hypothetical protein